MQAMWLLLVVNKEPDDQSNSRTHRVERQFQPRVPGTNFWRGNFRGSGGLGRGGVAVLQLSAESFHSLLLLCLAANAHEVLR